MGLANRNGDSFAPISELGDPRRHASFLGVHNQPPGFDRNVPLNDADPFEKMAQNVLSSGSVGTGGENKVTDHGGASYARVFVNAEAAQAITTDNVDFPVGSTIVREKLASETALSPEVLTVMIKRWRGFSPKTNDWEFLVVGGEVNKVKKRQKTGNCAECHSEVRQSDFVNRIKYQ